MGNLAKVYPIHHKLWAIDEAGKTLMYLYAGEKRVLLVDTGFGLTDLKALAASLCPGKEIIVVNTHAHGDHNSGNNQFDTVYVGRMDEPFSYRQMDEEGIRDFWEGFLQDNPRTQGVRIEDWHPGPSRQVIPLTDGDTLDLGGITLEVLETPGHTIGSICLLDRTNGYLFTGDLMLTWEVWGQLESSSALKVYADSLQRLASLQDQVTEIFPAHGVPDNPFGWPLYHLPPRTLTVYAQGTQRIVDGKDVGKPYRHPGSLYVLFEIGGMAYDPKRIGVEK